jgi:hypothetical protein
MDNPMAHYIRQVVSAYMKLLSQYGDRAILPLKNVERVTAFNTGFLTVHYTKLAKELGDKTRSFIVEAVDEVIQATINHYNELHRKAGYEPLDGKAKDKLWGRIRKDFLLAKFKRRTLDARVDNATIRLMANILPIIQTYATASTDHDRAIATMVDYFTGTHPIPGGTAARWNGRLLTSELFRAYQFTAKQVLMELKVPKVKWVNTDRHTEENITDEYAATTYTPRQLPRYPYPCNDSFFVPIYKEELDNA